MTKAEIRQKVWQTIQREGAARFPGALGRVPNFAGAERAAQLLREMAVWRRALVVKVNPDAPQLPVRRLALAEGKILYMAVPRLRTEKCFVEIDPQRLGKKAALAASIAGACRWGRAVSPREMRPVDLVVCGSVAVGRDGARLGKGGGYCDLEYGLLREEGKVRESTPILTTVHPLQVVVERITMLPHDLPVDFLVTPTEVVATRPAHPRPRRIDWDLRRPLKINAIPLLRKRLKRGGTGTPSPRRLCARRVERPRRRLDLLPPLGAPAHAAAAPPRDATPPVPARLGAAHQAPADRPHPPPGDAQLHRLPARALHRHPGQRGGAARAPAHGRGHPDRHRAAHAGRPRTRRRADRARDRRPQGQGDGVRATLRDERRHADRARRRRDRHGPERRARLARPAARPAPRRFDRARDRKSGV